MIDGGESAHQRECDPHLQRCLRCTDQEQRCAHAKEKHEHHRTPSPVIAVATGGQRGDAEHHESASGVRHQILPARELEFNGNRAHRSRENQQRKVIDRMGEVEQDARFHSKGVLVWR
jgi:hypothetical protein